MIKVFNSGVFVKLTNASTGSNNASIATVDSQNRSTNKQNCSSSISKITY